MAKKRENDKFPSNERQLKRRASKISLLSRKISIDAKRGPPNIGQFVETKLDAIDEDLLSSLELAG